MEFSFQISGQEYQLPTVLTTKTFQSAMMWDIEDIKNHKPFVSVITECPIHQLSLLDEQTFNIVLAACITLLPSDTGEVKKQCGVFTIRDFNSFSFGDFIDIDVYIADGLTKHIVDLVSKLYNMSVNIAESIDVNQIWNACIAVVKWRELVYKEHDEFFELSDRKNDDQEFTINNLQLMWYEATLALAEHQFLNIQHVVERPYKEALNFLTWKKNEVAKLQLEQVKRKYDLQKRT